MNDKRKLEYESHFDTPNNTEQNSNENKSFKNGGKHKKKMLGEKKKKFKTLV